MGRTYWPDQVAAREEWERMTPAEREERARALEVEPDESKPPMRQIAELIDGIATARAESAESLLTMCEHQLTLARRDASDLRSILDDQARSLDERDAEIARISAEFESEQTLRSYREEQLRLLHQDSAAFVRERNEARHEVETWQREYSGALADFEHAQAEIARLKAELAAERERMTATVTCSRVVPTATEIRTYMDKLADQPRTGGYVPPPAPPADDPRIAALCDLAFALFQLKEHNCDDVSRSVRRTMSSKHVELLGGTPVRR